MVVPAKAWTYERWPMNLARDRWSAAFRGNDGRSARVVFHHQVGLHHHRVGNLIELRDARELRRHLVVVDLHVVRDVALGEADSLQHHGKLLGGFLDLDDVAGLAAEARNVDAPAVHLDVAVIDELAGGKHRRHELGAEHDGVEPALQEADEVGAGIALEADRLLIDAAEMLLGNVAVVAFELLLGAQLHAVVGELALAALAVLAGAVFAPVHGALRAAPDILPHAAVELVLGFMALGHRVLMRLRLLRIAPSSVPRVPCGTWRLTGGASKRRGLTAGRETVQTGQNGL